MKVLKIFARPMEKGSWRGVLLGSRINCDWPRGATREGTFWSSQNGTMRRGGYTSLKVRKLELLVNDLSTM